MTLHADGHTLPEGEAAMGKVRDDGSFDVSIYGNGGGVPPGNYTATVQWFKLVSSEGGAGRGPNVLPPKYASPQGSPIRITVREGANVLDPIEIQ